jgi:ABC-type proline/glycine betaine transport system permease subunit
MDNLFLQSLFQHAALSLVPGAVGAILGVSLARLILSRAPGSKLVQSLGFAYWIPWRGLLVALFVFLLPNVFPVIWLGPGSLAAGVIIFLATFLLSLTILVHFSRLLEGDQSPRFRSLSAFRTALTAAVGLGVIGRDYGAGGAGVLIQHGIQVFEYQLMWLGYGIVAVLAVLTDFVVALIGWRWLIIPGNEIGAS